MPKPQTQDDKKHGDKLEPLIERASGRENDDDEEELEDEDDEDALDDDEDEESDDDERD